MRLGDKAAIICRMRLGDKAAIICRMRLGDKAAIICRGPVLKYHIFSLPRTIGVDETGCTTDQYPRGRREEDMKGDRQRGTFSQKKTPGPFFPGERVTRMPPQPPRRATRLHAPMALSLSTRCIEGLAGLGSIRSSLSTDYVSTKRQWQHENPGRTLVAVWML
jgi:hypothetical protein